MMRKVVLSSFLLITGFFLAHAQNSVGIGVANPNKNAVLELVSQGNNQGLLVPKLTTAQRTATAFISALSNRENGLLVFDQTENKFYFWQINQWQPLRVGSELTGGNGVTITGNTIASIPQDLQLTGSTLTITNNPAATPISLAAFTGTNTDDQTLTYNGTTGELAITRLSGGSQTVTLAPAGVAGGDLTGSFPNPTIATNAITTTKILDGTIATADIANAAVSDEKIATGIAVNKLASGTLNQVLTSTAGGTAWSTPTFGSVTSVATGTGLSGGPITTTGIISLANTGVTASTYGSATTVPQIVIDAQGRITSATPVTIAGVAPGGAASGDFAGTYPSPTIAATSGNNIVGAVNNAATMLTFNANRLSSTVVLDTESPIGGDLSGTFGTGLSINNNAVTTSKISPGSNGQLLSTAGGVAAWSTPTFGTVTSVATGTGLSGGPISTTGTISLTNTGVTATTYGSATTVPQIVVDAQGRINSATPVTITGVAPGGAASGDFAGSYPSPTIAATSGNNIVAAINNAATTATLNTNRISSNVVLDTESPVGGDLSGTYGTGLTINNNAVTTSKIAPGTNGQVLTTAGGVTTWSTGVSPSGAAGGDLTGTYPTPQVANSAITSAKIVDATIVNADISGTAAIAVSKLAPGANTQVLTVGGGVAQWATFGGGALINDIGTDNLNAGNSSSTGGTDNAVYGEFASVNNSGNFNVIIGTHAANSKTGGDLNTIIGWYAGGSNTNHQGNTFVGAQAGELAPPSANVSTLIGEKAGRSVQGTSNTMVGQRAGEFTTTGFYNVFMGNLTAATNTIGDRLTIIGNNANVSANNLTNATALGEGTIVNASNKVRIGNTTVSVIEGQVAFTAASDRRLKNNIEDLDAGLDFISKLKPVRYQMKNGDGRTNWGFIAQDIESILGTKNAMLTIGGDRDRTLGLRYTDFVAPLVKAVQEQQKEVETLQKQLLESEERIRLLETTVKNLSVANAETQMMKEELEKIKRVLGMEANVKGNLK